MIFAPSPRRVTIAQAKDVRAAIPIVSRLGVFDDSQTREVGEVADYCSSTASSSGTTRGRTVPVRRLDRAAHIRVGRDDLVELERLQCDAVHLDASSKESSAGRVPLPRGIDRGERPSVPFVLSGGSSSRERR